jgi:MFS family permease
MEAKDGALVEELEETWRYRLAGIFLATLASFLAIGAVLPILPRYVHGPIGAGDVAVGVVIGAYAISAIVMRPWAGRAVDRRGRRPIAIVGALMMALGGALLFVRAGVPGLVVARLVVGIGEALVFTAGSVWSIDLAPGARRAQMVGLFGLSVWGGLSLGPAIGEALDALAGYEAVWAFAALSPLVGALIATRLPGTRPAPAPRTRQPLIAREALGPGFALALANVGYATMAGFVGLLLAEGRGGHGALVFVVFAISIVLTRLLLGRTPDRLGAKRSAVLAALGQAAGLAIVAVAPSWEVAAVGAMVMGWGFSLMYPGLALIVVDRVGEDRRGAALGTLTAAFDLGFGIGGPLAGALAAIGSYELAFWVAAAVALMGAFVSSRVAVGRSG